MVLKLGLAHVGAWRQKLDKPGETTSLFFNFFNEINIIGQLSSRLLERRLPDGFIVAHFGVLNHLIRLGDERTPLQLAKSFQVPKTTMTHTLTGLEKAQLIEFISNPNDGRSKLVLLTEKGHEFHKEALAQLTPDIATMANFFDCSKISEAMPILMEMRQYLDQEREN